MKEKLTGNDNFNVTSTVVSTDSSTSAASETSASINTVTTSLLITTVNQQKSEPTSAKSPTTPKPKTTSTVPQNSHSPASSPASPSSSRAITTTTTPGCISSAITTVTSVDIALVIDSSTSISRAYFQAIQSFIKLWAKNYSIGAGTNQVQFAFVTYSLWAAGYGSFSTVSDTIETLDSVVDDLAYQNHNDRNMFDALTKVSNTLTATGFKSGWRSNATHLMVVFSGDSFTGPDWRSIANNLRPQFDRVVAVGLTPNAATNQFQELLDLVGGDTSKVLYIRDSNVLPGIISWLESYAC
uniref:VWFA domain-containing protein n=1 Tax=Plectus sambesii TaxID=2011161 RepID=A0A914X5S6_9BILA